MKKLLLAAASLSVFAAAAPAAAQYHPGYDQPRGYGYNEYDQQGLIRSYIVRADQLRQRVERLDSRDRISEREARQLRSAAADLQRRAREFSRNGLNVNERRDLDYRFARIQQQLRTDVRDGNGNRWAGRGSDYGRDNWVDRNRNGIDDRQEGLRHADRDRDGVYDGRDGWVDRNRNGVDDRYEQRRWDRDDD